MRYLDEDMNRQFGASPARRRRPARPRPAPAHPALFADGAPTALRVHYDLHTAIRENSLIEQFALCAAPTAEAL